MRHALEDHGTDFALTTQFVCHLLDAAFTNKDHLLSKSCNLLYRKSKGILLNSKLNTMDTSEIHDTTPVIDEPMTDVNNMVDSSDIEITPKTEEEYAQAVLTLRAIVSSKEAGIIIGKAGKNVADLRDETGVKAGVSKVVPGVHDRVLTVTGPLQGTARAYAIVAKSLVEGAPQMGMGGIVSNNGTHRKYNVFFFFNRSTMFC